jgi:hypothetical protein
MLIAKCCSAIKSVIQFSKEIYTVSAMRNYYNFKTQE